MKRKMLFTMVAVLVLSMAAFAFAGPAQSKAPKLFKGVQPAGTKATCPVSNQEISVEETTPHSKYEGHVAYFAGAMGKQMFDKDPNKYVAPILFDEQQKAGAKATCAVSGQELTVGSDTPHSVWNGKHVYFAGPMGKQMFDAHPLNFIPGR
jgi:YHS domain-containing protein